MDTERILKLLPRIGYKSKTKYCGSGYHVYAPKQIFDYNQDVIIIKKDDLEDTIKDLQTKNTENQLKIWKQNKNAYVLETKEDTHIYKEKKDILTHLEEILER